MHGHEDETPRRGAFLRILQQGQTVLGRFDSAGTLLLRRAVQFEVFNPVKQAVESGMLGSVAWRLLLRHVEMVDLQRIRSTFVAFVEALRPPKTLELASPPFEVGFVIL
ncbi:MAG: hypothetical protein U1G07_09075 [Verrucomicrobiota bacterium]